MALRPTTKDWTYFLKGKPFAGFFETGTFKGELARMAMATGHFERVITCDNNSYYYNLAKEPDSGVEYYFAESTMLLRNLLPLEGRWLFHLDAHFFGDKDGKLVRGRAAFPLWNELDLITQKQPEWLILVDDVHCFGTHHEWIEVDEKSLSKYGSTEIYDDVCIIHQPRRNEK